MPSATVLPARQRTPEWLAAREHGIGASQAAAAIGLSDWQSPIGLWAEKLGLVPPATETLPMRIGAELEPLIATLYTEATGIKVRRANNLRQHPTHTFMLASLDRRAGRKPIELKWSVRATGYGEPGTDEVPDDVLVQVLHQLAVLDEPEGEVALLRAGAREVAIYPIRRDAEAEAEIVEREAEFWAHVESRTEPPVDGSEATRRTLNALFKRDADAVLEADTETAAAMYALRDVRRQLIAFEASRDELENAIRAAMLRESATLVRAPGVGEIPWRPTKPRETTDWKLVAHDYRAAIERELAMVESGDMSETALPSLDDLDAIASLHTETKETAPRFGPAKWETEEENHGDSRQ